MKKNISNLEEKINGRIGKLRKGYARKAFLKDPDLPITLNKNEKSRLVRPLALIETSVPQILNTLKKARKHIPQIWDETGEAAAYLLIGKAVSNLESMILLAKKGKSLELVDLSRSGMESLDLAFLFLEDGQEERRSKWFKGKIIENEKARKQLHQAINQDSLIVKRLNKVLPIKELTTDIYKIYSLYTHSSYAAVLDLVDVFHEDLDFHGYAGFHYTNQYLHLIQNLAINILLRLKHLFIKLNDSKCVAEADEILKRIEYKKMDAREINKVFEAYPIQND